MDIEDLIEKRQEYKDASEKLDSYLKVLLEEKLKLKNELDQIQEEVIKPRKDEMSQLDHEICRIMQGAGMDKFTVDKYGAYTTTNTILKITDKSKAFEFAMNNPSVLKKDIFKVSELEKMIAEGHVPDPDKDGIDCNDTYEKITYRRR